MMSATALILVVYFIQESLGHALPQSPIVGIAGGHAVNIEDAPFMAALLYIDPYINKTYAWCGGSIIHKQFVLTSAWCTTLNPLTVRVGSSRYDEGGKLHQVEKYFTHESFSFGIWYINNVALLKLSEPVTFGPSVSWIKLADASVNIPVGLTANVTGWGENKYQNVDALCNLQQVSVTVSPLDDCINHYKYTEKQLTDKHICANNGAIGPCLGDLGGPLIAGNHQIGIFMDGVTCWNHPNVFEKVAPHLQWIRNKINENL